LLIHGQEALFFFDWAALLICCQNSSDWNQLHAVDVQQETPAAFKAQLASSVPVACHMP